MEQNALDRLIGWLSPEAGARRMAWRARMEIAGMQQRRYAAARRDHRTEGWDAKGWSARAEAAWDAKLVRDRVRSLMRDNGHMVKALNSLVDYVVGPGILGTPRGGSGRTSKKLRSLFDEFVDTCDFYGEQDLYGLQNQAFRSFGESGDVFLRKHRTGRGRIPFALQVMEIDHLDTSKSGKAGDGFIDRGIEYDALGRKTAFWLFEVHPGDRSRWSPLSMKSVRVPTDQVIHLFDPLRPGQDRGVSLFAPAVMAARDLQEYFVAEDTRKRIEACLAGFVTSEEAVEMGADGKSAETLDGKIVESFVPGMITRLRPGEQITIAQPASADGVAEYAQLRLREIAAAPGVMYEMITGDFSNVNYTSWRAGHHTFQRRVEYYQWLRAIPMVCARIGEGFRDAVIAAQLAPTSDFVVKWTPPGFISVDPLKDAKADELDLVLGKIAPSEMIERRGENFEEHLDRVANDRKAAAARALKFAWERQPKAAASGKEAKVENQTAPSMTRSAVAVAERPAAVDRRALEIIYRDLELRKDTLALSDAESEFTVDVVWTTGMRGVRFDWERWDYIEEELSTDKKHVRLDRLNAGAPVLNAHSSRNLKDIIGVVVEGSARMEKGQGVATLRIVSTPDIADIVTKIRAGVIKNISVGYTVHQYDITEKQGQRPLYRAVDWEPYEISFVPMPFDWKAQARSADAAQGGFPCIFRRSAPPILSQERNMDEDEIPGGEQQPANTVTQPVQQQRQVQQRAPETPPAPPALKASDITKIVRDAGLDAEVALDIIGRHETAPLTREAVLEEVLAKRAAKDAPPTNGRHSGAITVTADQRDKTIRGIENSIVMRAGLGELLATAAKVGDFQRRHGLSGDRYDLDAGEFRGIKMVNLARMALDRAGIQVRSYDDHEIVARALVSRDGGLNTTGDFAVALENVMHKALQAAYVTQPDAWTKFCGVGSVTDFRLHNRYLRGSFGRLDGVNEHGEFKNKSIPDAAKETIKAGRFGNIVGLTREAIVNDDLGIFDSILPDLGRAGKLSIEVDVFTLLTSNSGMGPTMGDTKTMIHVDHGNSGTSAAPTTESFDEARQLMAKQKDISGNEYLDIRPAIWLGPLSKGGLARVLNDAQYDPDTANKLQRPNMVRGLFREIVDSPRLSGNAWWAFADPSQAPAIEVVFLNGESLPQLDTKDGWRIDGIEARVKHEYGVGGVNWRSVVRNAGG